MSTPPKLYKKRGCSSFFYRLFEDGKDKWRTTGTADRRKAVEIARAAKDAAKGRGEVETYFRALVVRIAGQPQEEQPEIRRRFARRLTMIGDEVLPLADAWAIWMASPAKGTPGTGTLEGYRAYWTRFTDWTKKVGLKHVHEITAAHVEDYSRDLWGENVAPRTFNGHIVFLRAMFNILKSKAGILDNPFDGIKTLQKDTQGRESFSSKELRTICRRAEGATRALIGVGLFTGLRLGDAVNLPWSAIQTDKITLAPSKTKRRGKVLIIPMHPALARLLAERRAAVPGDYVFPAERKLYATHRNYVTKQFQTFLHDCGITTTEAATGHRKMAAVRKGFHSLRHSFISLCAANNVPQVAIQDLVGHSSAAMTQIYSHSDFEQKQKAISALPGKMFKKGKR